MKSPISEKHAEQMFKTLEMTVPILARVVADNLMPEIAAPAYPGQVLRRVEELLEEIQRNRVQYGPALADRIASDQVIQRALGKS